MKKAFHHQSRQLPESLESMILMSASAAELNPETLSEGTSGNDVIISLTPDELLDGGDGHDIMIGLGGSNVLRGGAGHDTLISVRGDNVLDGGAGIDKAVYWNANRADYTVIDHGFGILEIAGDRHSDFITNIEQVQFQDGTYSIEELLSGSAKAPAQGDLQTEDAAEQTVDSLKSPTSGNDVLLAGSSTEAIDGLAGDDVILGLGNGNSISGGDGDDALISAGGSNLIDGGNGRDTVIYTNGVRADYTIAPAAGGATSVTSSSGNDILLNVEIISFQDETVQVAAPPVVTDPVEEEVIEEEVVVDPIEEEVIEEEVVDPIEEEVIEEEVVDPIEEEVIEEEVVDPIEEEVVEEEVVDPIEEEVVEEEVVDPIEEEVVEEEFDGVVADYTVPVAGSVYGNVSDGSASQYQLKSEPSVGSLNFYGNGAFDFHAPVGFSGVVSFTYTVTGEDGQTEEREVLVLVGDAAGNEVDDNENEEVIDEEVIVDDEDDAEMDDDCGYDVENDYSDDSDDYSDDDSDNYS
ncbi:MAG: Ig-like domain-containing protein, partial [Planctomyces sp.]